jgi:phosphoribosylformylglycinamidine synthase
VRSACERWELPCTVLGEVTDHGELRAFHGGEAVGAIPASFLTEDTPRYDLELAERVAGSPPPPDPVNDDPKTWIFEQYDHLVGSRTVRRPGFDAAVLRLDGIRGIAVSLGGPPIGERDPFQAGRRAVLTAALNVACAGGEPIALTDCLNFGSPERPEIAWELARAIDGITEAANELGIPVVSGNVSLYNETGGRPIPPTPAVGCVGLVADVTRIPSRWNSGDRGFLLRGEGAELVRFVWENASRFTLAHDIRDGEKAVREAAAWSGVETELACPDGPGVIVTLDRADTAPLGWGDAVQLGAV